MLQVIDANLLAFGLALLIGLLVAWWLFRHGSSGAAPAERRPDVLDEGAAPAARNQALIDAPPAADIVPPAMAGIMGGIGEVIAVAAHDEVEAAHAAEAPPPPPPAGGDELRRIKGVGPKLVTLLGSLGVTSLAQVAAWDDAEIDRLDAQLGSFAGRIRRDNWVEQARLLTGGDMSAYEAKFGKL